MNLGETISEFIKVIEEDPRIGPSHVSLFLAIVITSKKHGDEMPVLIFRKQITKQAKISAATFHRCINELQDFGYLRYVPSFNPLDGSIVYVNKLSIK